MDRRVVVMLATLIIVIATASALVCFVPYSHSDDSAAADESECLNFTFPEGGGQIWITNKGGNSPDCKYSTDGKATWTDFESDKKVDVAGGGKVYVKGDNPLGFSSTNKYTKFGMDVKSIGETVSASGSVMSLIDGDRASTLTIPNEYCFDGLFYECGVLSSAPVLPATTLANCCYYGMFASCTSLTVAPALPATVLAENCYCGMFRECTSLTVAPALPATALAFSCYCGMFASCTSLTVAPALPATELAYNCYASMFTGCTSLNTVLCLATNISGKMHTNNWLDGVSSTGNFYTHCDDWQEGASGIPSGWTKHNDFIAVTFDPMGGTPIRDGKPITNYSIADSSGKIAFPSAERAGWGLEGWYTEPEGGTKIESDKVYTEDTTIYAHWKEGYTLTFDPNGGTGGPSTIAGKGKVTLPTTVPTYTGNTFIGWKEKDKETIYSPGGEYNLTAGVTLYAVWGGTIIFNPTVGTGEFEIIVKENGDKIAAPTAPVHSTLTFQGWSCDGTTIYNPGDNYTVSGDATFYAMWGSGSNYIISFDLKGGSDVGSSFNVTKVSEGASYTIPSDTPSKTGYSFAGWKYDGTTYNPGRTVTVNKDMEFEAQWTINKYKITFNSDGGSSVDPIEQNFGTTVTKPADPSKTGYTFKGWSPAIPDTMPAENITVKAIWEINYYTITFDTDGGFAVSSITLPYGSAVTKPADPVKTGYTFDGWNKEIPATMPADDVTVKATWKINQYTITFDTDGGSSVNPITSDYGSPVTAPANPTKKGCLFVAWNTPIPATMPAHDMEIKAIWTPETGAVCFVSFDLNGGSGSFATIRATDGTATLPSDRPVKMGFVFEKWVCNGTFYNPGDVISVPTDMTLTAVYEPNKYTVEFDANGGEGTMKSVDFEYGRSYDLPANAFTKDGFRFVGWSVDGTKVVKYTDEENVANLSEGGTVTLYAVWEPMLEIKTDAVDRGDSFDMEISEGKVDAVTVAEKNGTERVLTYGTDYELSNSTAVRVLGTCTGKLSEGDCVFRVYTENGGVAEGTVRITDSRPDPPTPPEPTPTYYEVSYDIAGGSEPGPGTMMYNEGYTAKAASYNGEKDGYYFDGWSCGGKTYKAGDEFVVSGNMRFTAIWVPNSNPAPGPSEDNIVMIIGIAVGIVATVALIGGTTYFIRKR